MFAVIKTGGRQFRVVPDDVLEIGKIAGDVGTGALPPLLGLPVAAAQVEHLTSMIVGALIVLILMLIGAKILLAEGLHIDMPNWISLIATILLLAGGVFYSLYRTRRDAAGDAA